MSMTLLDEPESRPEAERIRLRPFTQADSVRLRDEKLLPPHGWRWQAGAFFDIDAAAASDGGGSHSVIPDTAVNSEIADNSPTPLHRFSIREFAAMQELGILTEGEPSELLDGLIVWKDRSSGDAEAMTVNRAHVKTIALFTAAMQKILVDHTLDAHVQVQSPVTLSDCSCPEPDLAIVRGQMDQYDEHPRAADLWLVIEVAHSSLALDRREKQQLYAAAGIAEYWIVNLRDGQVECHRLPDPVTRQYQSRTILTETESIEFVHGSVAVTLPVASLLAR